MSIDIDSNNSFIEKTPSKSNRPHLNKNFPNIITKQEVESLIKCAISVDARLVNYYLRPYSEEKLGFLGAHLCLVVVVKGIKSNDNCTCSYFIKTIPYSIPSQAAYIEEKGCFRKETDFFKCLEPILTKDYKGESWAPKCYLTKEHTLVFEDMKLRGYSNRSKLFDEETTKSAVACIARFHACSILAEERLNGKPLNQLYPELLEEAEFKRTGKSYAWFTCAVNLAISIANDLGLDSTHILKACHRVFDMCEPSKNKRNVVNHGDLWSSNMIFDGMNNCCLVDFQFVRYAPLAHDPMQLIYLCTSRDFRKRCEYQMLNHYYVALKETLLMNNFKGIVPSFEEVLQGAEEQRLPAVVTAMIFHPTVLMDGKTAAKIMNDPETYAHYYFKDRKSYVYEIMSKDAEYERWIKETVKELTEISLNIDNVPRLT